MKYLITGAQGQDGSIISELLFERGHEVIAVGRRRLDDFSLRDQRILELINQKESSGSLFYEICDLRDSSAVTNLIAKHRPESIINLAALSSPAESWSNPAGTMISDTIAVINLLDAMRLICPNSFYLQACTAAIFGASAEPIHENSEIDISSPYASAKYASLNISRQYRERYKLKISNAIMFNHESIWRPDAFVTRKITKSIARIRYQLQEYLDLWTLSPIRDWGWAIEYMEALIIVSEKKIVEDFILATGSGASIKEFAFKVFELANLEPEKHLRINSSGLDTGVDISVGNAKFAFETFGWKPRFTWKDVAENMFSHDSELAKNEARRQGVDLFETSI